MKSCIVIGGGASVEEGINLGLWDKIKEQEIWSINFAFMTMPFLPKRELWIDTSFFRNNLTQLENLYKQGVSCHTKKNNKYALITEINTYDTSRNRNEALSSNKIFVGSMGLSGFFALSLACKEEYNLVYILGYDFGKIENKDITHYYQNKLNIISSGVNKPELYLNNNQVKKEVEEFDYYLNYKTKIVNVSPKSKINCFEKIDYPEFFRRLNGNLS